MRLLLLSNSTNHGLGFLEHAEEMLRRFFGTRVQELLFVPYAAV
ncbi:MAG: Type 1 glutamine amidotransferase-like domain-containing protein, partial [Gemmatimonadota bacterium]|nr:Type 1 glutamine amidotransferase-like domain-containing protein [Gemmatimonadota bacterium]